MAKIIHYSKLVRQHHLNFLEHKCREYREREDYLLRLRKLLFNIEAQMRQAELQQLEVFRQMVDHFKVPLKFPSLGDRVGLQQLFASHPFLFTLQEFFEARLTGEECYQKIMDLLEKVAKPPKE